MNRVRSIAYNSVSRILAGGLLYLSAVRLASAAHWLPRLIGLMVLVVLPFSALRQILTSFGVEVDLVWILLPAALAGLIPLGSSR